MKKSASLITYVAALVIGIILLVYNQRVELLKGIVIAMGVLITVPSAIMLLNCFIGKKDRYGNKQFPAWYTVIVAIAGLVLGVWMLCMPSSFQSWMVYTLGVILILVGAAQIVFIYTAARPYGANPLWYCVPILVLAGGFIVCFIGPQGVNTWVSLTTGILLVVYAVNGIAATGRECRLEHEIKEEKEEAKQGEIVELKSLDDEADSDEADL